MAEWYVKDLSNLTQVSVQTLHHYDRIDLLKPSVRLPNGYRLYSEKDLLKLQQIIALKFFGFELSQIKELLATGLDMLEHFTAQSQFLENKAKTLLQASDTLKSIIADCKLNKSIPWKTIINLIEVYKMSNQLEHAWAGKVLNQEELNAYVHFEQELKTKYSEKDKKDFEEKWHQLVLDINANLTQDPVSEVGMALGKRCMDLVNSLYGKKYIALRNAIWEKGFKGGHVNEERGLSKESVAWLDKAIDAYYQNRMHAILNGDQSVMLKEWSELLTDMCGDNQSLKNDMIKSALDDNKVSQAGKNFLKKI